MIKNNKVTNKYNIHAPDKDWMEVYDIFRKKGCKNISLDFMDMVWKEIPTFWRIHKPLENAIRKLQQNDQE